MQSGWHKEKQRFPRDGQLEGIRGKENESNPSLGKKKKEKIKTKNQRLWDTLLTDSSTQLQQSQNQAIS